MDDRLDSEIRAHAAALLAGELGFEAFEDWLISSTWAPRRGDRAETAALAVGLLGAITPFKEGEISADALRREVEIALHTVTAKR